MTDLHRQAIHDLVVMAAAAAAVSGLLVLTGDPLMSVAGFALVALTGRRRPLRDERDEQISRRASATAYGVFWVCFVLWGVAVTLAYRDTALVPLELIAPAVWVGGWLVVTVRSVAVLVLDRSGA